MGVEERSLRVYDTKKTFFSKIGTTFSKILTPTKVGINNWLISIKRNTVMKNYKIMQNANDNKKESSERNFENSYSLYLESLDELVINTIYKKVTIGTASVFEKEALSKYYNVIHLKENDEIEFKHKKQQYLLNLDFNTIKETNRNKLYEEYSNVYLYEMEQLYKSLLKHYSMKLTEKMDIVQKQDVYDRIFDTLDDYVTNIIPLKEIKDEEIIKECSLFETYEVGKLDQVDMLDKRMILLGISRKLFVHSLPLVVAEKCYIKLLKDVRSLIVDTKIPRKRENAYQLLLRLIDQYNDKLLDVKIYWDKPEEKKEYNIFADKRKALEKLREEKGLHEYDNRKQILYLREDMTKLEKYENKYFKILQFYRGKLVEIGDMREIKNKLAKAKCNKYIVVKGIKKVIENETAC